MSGGRHLASEVSAPGKAFVIGEFAALRGAPALVAALDRRVRVQAHTIPGTGWSVRLEDAVATTTDLADLLAAGAPGDLLAAVVQELGRLDVPLPHGLVLTSDRRPLLTPAGASLGLGSSAASAVALVAALAPELSRDRREAAALAAHRAFQGGHGSGYDVVASHRGGLCVVFVHRDRPRAARVELGPWALLVASGPTEVETVGVVAAVEATAARSGAARGALDALREVSERVTAELKQGRYEGLADAMRQFVIAERHLGELAGVAIVPDAVVALDAELAELGGACKPSGAGGDELIVAVVPHAEQGRAVALVEDAGYAVVAARIDDHGLEQHRP